MDSTNDIVNSLTHLLEVLQKFNPETIKFILLLIVIFCIYLTLTKWINFKNDRKYYDSMVKEKNQEIERLADDNRKYREIYLNNIGISKEKYDSISAERI